MTPPASADLAGKVAVVTGVAGRLGCVWTGCFLAAGARVVGIDVRTERSVRLEDTLARHPPESFVRLRADVTDRPSLERALAECQERFGTPDILVNNAGIDQPPSRTNPTWRFGEIPDEVSAAVLSVNAHGTLRACQVFGPEMARRGRGSVINISSLYANAAPDPRLYSHLPVDPPFLKPPAYGMSKAGVTALTRYLAAFWGRTGVRVNSLTLGGVAAGQDEHFRRKYNDRVPMGRMAEESDLSGPLLFLASEMSSYVTGTDLVVDGGYLCW